ncbi:response regulator [uncultured Algoriphagus sp.]|uniref:response regulator n=1 Tax=uncultured Algoriphagus sp. TaxID=417365 RepID=UPI0030ECCF89|tara:strand:+ start:1030 stop:1446 length:417 start_codon:yes stop_codon:yes gene_type:complete
MTEVNCLLIDDDPDDREFFKIALFKVPFYVNLYSAPDGLCGLDILNRARNKPQYIFLDLNMPLLSGKELLSKIRQLKDYNAIPIIILSTSSFHTDIEECQKLGASHFLTKVFNIQLLTDIITKLVSGAEMPYVLNFQK